MTFVNSRKRHGKTICRFAKQVWNQICTLQFLASLRALHIGTTSRPNFNYISTLFQRQMPAGMSQIPICELSVIIKFWSRSNHTNNSLLDDTVILDKICIDLNRQNFFRIRLIKSNMAICVSCDANVKEKWDKSCVQI